MKIYLCRLLSAVLAALMLCTVAHREALAQTTAQPTEEQAKLNAKAVEAIVEEDYERAAKLLEVSLELGELNVIWLNLGRAYHKLGRCEDAKEAYLEAVSAPAVEDPSPRIINAKADQYLAELEEGCEKPDDGEVLAHDPAEHGDEDGGDAQASAGEADEPQDEPAASQTEPSAESQGSSNVLAWSLTAAGLAVAGGGVGLHFWAESVRDEVRGAPRDDNDVIDSMTHQEALDKQSQANQLDTAAVATIAAGAVITGGGLYLLFSSDDVEAAPTAAVGPDGGVSVGISGRF